MPGSTPSPDAPASSASRRYQVSIDCGQSACEHPAISYGCRVDVDASACGDGKLVLYESQGRLSLEPGSILEQCVEVGPRAPAVAQFNARHPDVRFEISVSDRIVDLVEEGFDLAIRISPSANDQLVARRLGVVRLWLAASPGYLAARGTPRKPADLSAHAALTYAYALNPRIWRLVDGKGVVHDVRVSGPLHCNSGDLSIAAAIAGLGIVLEPDFMLQPALATGALVRVMPEYESPPADIWALYPSRRHLSAKVRVFVDHVVALFASTRPSSARARPGSRRRSA